MPESQQHGNDVRQCYGCPAMIMQTHNPETWQAILSHGSLAIPTDQIVVGVQHGLPSLTLVGYPDSFGMRVVDYLREWGWLLPYRMTVKVMPEVRRAQPSMQSVASYVQSALLHAERIAA